MTSIVIAEKPTQKGDYEAAIGTTYGRVYAARGHLFTLAQPEVENPDWKEWSIGLLRPESGFYKIVPTPKDADMRKRYEAIRNAAKKADTIYIATDPDREGEGIGRNILNQLVKDIRWSGRAMRVMPLGTDKKSIEESFRKARPADEFGGLYQSYLARSQGDQIFNLSATRSASRALLPEGRRASLSVGRVLTPAFGMVCRRHLEIENFKPEKYFLPWVDVEGASGKVRLTHSPKEADRLFDRSVADRIARSVAAFNGSISVIEERKKQTPPHLFSLSSLQVTASNRLKWSMTKTTDVLQQLYEKHKVATYPRSSEVSLPEAEIENIPAMKAGALSLPFFGNLSWASAEPVVRRTKGAFSDRDLKGAAHYAIVPNVNTADKWSAIYPNMSADEKKLFELIVRRYLSAIGPDRVYDSTRMSISVAGKLFGISGTVEVAAGWQEATGRSSTQEVDGDDQEGSLPPFRDGDVVKAVSHGIADKMTKPPAPYSDSNLGIAMVEAWKLVDDPEVRRMMKETEGIGTVGTRKDVVKNLIDRGFIALSKGKVSPTPEGLNFYRVIDKYTPDLLDVAVTGKMEISLERIKSGEFGARTAVEDICALAQRVIDGFVRAQSDGVVVAPPLAKGKGKKSFKGKAGGKGRESRSSSKSSGPPSEKQLALAEILSKQKGVPVPADARKHMGKMSAWITKHKK